MNLQRASTSTSKPGSGISRPNQPDFKEYVVRVQRNADKVYSVMKFNSGDNVDFTKWKKGTMGREDNLSAFKDSAAMPKFGEGSEYGRERREEARKKKYGIISKKYKEEDQPWILKQHEKRGKKYKGRKEGGINDNACHYIFTQMPDGSFCASPVKSWYKFTPMVQYKYLNDEEAEEEFGRRDKTLNFFSVMVKKRLKKDGTLEDDQNDEVKKSKAPRKKDNLQITEDDEYVGFLSDDDDFDDDSDDPDAREAKEKKAKKKEKNSKKRSRVKKKEWGEEAGEESDVDDYDDQEKDYLSEKSSDEEETIEYRKDEERGLDEEIEEINLSSEEELEEIKEPEVDEADNKEKDEKSKEEDRSSASGSDSDDSDIDDSKIQSAVFMQNKTQPKKTSGKSSKNSSRNSSRPGTPFTGDNATASTLTKVAGHLQEKGISNKRQVDTGSSTSSQSQTPGPPAAKKSRTESPTPCRGQQGQVRITEDVVRRYLMRKPMTTKDLLHKLNPKKTGMSPKDIVARLTEVMFKLNPKKEQIKDKVYWSIKAT